MSTEKTMPEVTETPKPKKKKSGLILVIVAVVTIIAGAFIGRYFWNLSNYLITENASVTSTLIHVVPPAAGRLDRFNVSVGSYVEENEIIGRVEHGGFLRSPVDGVVVRTNAVLNQVVSPMESVAVIADLNNLHIGASVEEQHISRLQVGQRAYVTIDALGREPLNAYISEIGMVTDAALTGNMMSFTTGGNFTRTTQWIPIQVRVIDDVNLENVIGVNATVRISLR